MVAATFPNPHNPWEGGILTTLSDEYSNLDMHGHGAKICAMTMIPSWALPFQPWTSGLDYKLLCAKMSRMAGHLAVVRDRDTGMVYPDPKDGRCRIKYEVSKFDKAGALECLLGMCRVMRVMGAEEIWLAKNDVAPFIRSKRSEESDEDDGDEGDDGINDPAFQAFLTD
ncbi:MAG: hypothetical protein Q9170_002719, partial [Blastenia crenularia]